MALTPEQEERLWKAVFGNGETGLVEEVRTMRRSLYVNPDTGEQGLIADVRDIKKMMIQVRGAWWLIGAILLILELLKALGVIPR